MERGNGKKKKKITQPKNQKTPLPSPALTFIWHILFFKLLELMLCWTGIRNLSIHVSQDRFQLLPKEVFSSAGLACLPLQTFAIRKILKACRSHTPFPLVLNFWKLPQLFADCHQHWEMTVKKTWCPCDFEICSPLKVFWDSKGHESKCPPSWEYY